MIGRILRALLARRGSTLLNLDASGRRDLAIVRETRALVPLLMHDAAALHIMSCVRAARELGGAMGEAGVFMGGSARLICEAKGEAPLHLFDVFETLQAPVEAPDAGEASIRAHFGKIHGSIAQVEQLLARYDGVHLYPGIFPASTEPAASTRFSFVHLDLDLAESTRDALDFFHPLLLAGGIIVGDDFADADVRSAFELHAAATGDTLIALPWSQGLLIKQGR